MKYLNLHYLVAVLCLLVPVTVLGQSSEERKNRSNDDVIKLSPQDKQSVEQSDDSSDNSSAESASNTGKDETDGDDETLLVPEVNVVGSKKGDIQSAEGSADVISEKDLEQQKPMSANEALRQLPGVHIQPEEGMGLRQNIGIRGLNPTRSRKVLVLEDGVPIALAPYGEPEMYYSPPVERMKRVEVVKGSGSILFGPQTVGGVVNYITPDPPENFSLNVEGRGGSYGYKMGKASVGDTNGEVGYWLNVMHQQYTGPRDLNLNLTDVTGKLKVQIDSKQSLELKLNVYDEWSQSTYLGLTAPQYKKDPRFNFAEHDRFFIRRYGLSAEHLYQLDPDALLETRLYAHNITRHWRRQDFQRTCSDSDTCGPFQRVINSRGENVVDNPSEWPVNTDEPAGSGVYYRNSSGNRNREFSVAGIEPRLILDWDLGEAENELKTGFRLHAEHTRERRIDGNHARSVTGTIRDDDERLGRAVSAYALNKFKLLDERLHISPGLRFESFWMDRTTFRTPVDGDITTLNPPRENNDHIMAVIPGLGASYQLLKPLTLYGGAHRGFAPPRTKDAISIQGQRLNLEAEYSRNYELGSRLRVKDYLSGQLTGFIMDFQNQIIAPAEAGGAVSVDPEQGPKNPKAVQGGETFHQGFETGFTFDPATYADLGFELPVSANYTFVDARFDDGWSTAIKGNELPYAPRHKGSARIRLIHPSGLSFQTDGVYVGGQYSDKVETVQESPDGLVGWIEPHFRLNAKLGYEYKPLDLRGYLTVKDIFDQRFVASRAPRGIKPGGFRKVFAGLQWDL
jgi:Fe(3+) dicitrate transport protein